ncbi:hypothetical protein LguiB_009918 [Lonicera macranthoides]
MSPSEMASHLPTKNKNASAMLDSIMMLLATHSIVTCSLSNPQGGGEVERLYGLTPTGELLAQNRSNFLFSYGRKYIDPWYHLKDTILEGGIEHVAGDMFVSVPGSEAILLKVRLKMLFNICSFTLEQGK